MSSLRNTLCAVGVVLLVFTPKIARAESPLEPEPPRLAYSAGPLWQLFNDSWVASWRKDGKAGVNLGFLGLQSFSLSIAPGAPCTGACLRLAGSF